jgi:hypothetical protein
MSAKGRSNTTSKNMPQRRYCFKKRLDLSNELAVQRILESFIYKCAVNSSGEILMRREYIYDKHKLCVSYQRRMESRVLAQSGKQSKASAPA